ncbi:hypothetical protein TNCV_2675421 [Trichonephila clavipes]|nr:hypothetical protein TNCV_2675421 [Trichonephila clavipes]
MTTTEASKSSLISATVVLSQGDARAFALIPWTTHPAPKMAIVPLKHNAYPSLQENVASSTLKKRSPPSLEVVRRKIRSIPKVSTLPTSPSNRVIQDASGSRRVDLFLLKIMSL